MSAYVVRLRCVGHDLGEIRVEWRTIKCTFNPVDAYLCYQNAKIELSKHGISHEDELDFYERDKDGNKLEGRKWNKICLTLNDALTLMRKAAKINNNYAIIQCIPLENGEFLRASPDEGKMTFRHIFPDGKETVVYE